MQDAVEPRIPQHNVEFEVLSVGEGIIMLECCYSEHLYLAILYHLHMVEGLKHSYLCPTTLNNFHNIPIKKNLFPSKWS